MPLTRESSQRCSKLDLTVIQLVPDPDTTPSGRDGIAVATERLHRLHGTSLLQSIAEEHDSIHIYATACVIFHRYLHLVSLCEHDVWSVALGSWFLALKLHDDDDGIDLKRLISTFARLYRRRRLGIGATATALAHAAVVCSQHPNAMALPDDAKLALFQRTVAPLHPLDPVFQEYKTQMFEYETRILRKMGFCLYWIVDQSVFQFTNAFVNALSKAEPKLRLLLVTPAMQRYAINSYQLDLCCTRASPEAIACACIYLAAVDASVAQSLLPAAWYQSLVADVSEPTLLNLANAIVSVSSHKDEDMQVANHCFVHSLVVAAPLSRFNDPGSLLWDRDSQALND